MRQQRFSPREAQEWRKFCLVLAIVFIGGSMSYVAISLYMPGINEWLGYIVFCGLVNTFVYAIDDVRKSSRSLFGWAVVLLAFALVGASFGSLFLPSTLLLLSRVLFGACIGLALPGPLRMVYEDGVALQKKRLSKESSPTDQ